MLCVFVFNFAVWHGCCCCHCCIWKFCIVFFHHSFTHMLGLALRHPIWYYPKIVILHSSLLSYSALFFFAFCNRIRLARQLNCDFRCDSLFPCVPRIVWILFRKQLVMHLLTLNLHDTAHPLKNAASYLMFCKQQIASNYLNCKSICGRFISVSTGMSLCEKNGHRVKSMNFKNEFGAVR